MIKKFLSQFSFTVWKGKMNARLFLFLLFFPPKVILQNSNSNILIKQAKFFLGNFQVSINRTRSTKSIYKQI